MKILIPADLYWPAINGVATFGRNLASGLAERGHEVMVIAPSQTGKKYQEIDQGCTIIRTRAVPFPFYQKFRISLYPDRDVKKTIINFQPDVIHIQSVLAISQAGMKYGNKFKIPTVITNHAMPENLMDNLRLLAPVSRPINFLLKEYGVHYFAKADYVTMPTQSAIDMFNESEKLSKPISPVSNGIDLKSFKPGLFDKKIADKFNLPSNIAIVSYIGRVDSEKHLYVLINAFYKALAKTPLHLLIVGGGTDIDNIKRQCSDLGIEKNVTLTGRVSDEEIVQLHRAATVFVMPSPAELQSIATLESMASGKPIIAVDAGALSELCQDGINGFLCEKDNEEQITKAILDIVSDPSKQKEFSKASLKIARSHDLDYTLSRFEQIYQDLINSRIESAT